MAWVAASPSLSPKQLPRPVGQQELCSCPWGRPGFPLNQRSGPTSLTSAQLSVTPLWVPFWWVFPCLLFPHKIPRHPVTACRVASERGPLRRGPCHPCLLRPSGGGSPGGPSRSPLCVISLCKHAPSASSQRPHLCLFRLRTQVPFRLTAVHTALASRTFYEHSRVLYLHCPYAATGHWKWPTRLRTECLVLFDSNEFRFKQPPGGQGEAKPPAPQSPTLLSL